MNNENTKKNNGIRNKLVLTPDLESYAEALCKKHMNKYGFFTPDARQEMLAYGYEEFLSNEGPEEYRDKANTEHYAKKALHFAIAHAAGKMADERTEWRDNRVSLDYPIGDDGECGDAYRETIDDGQELQASILHLSIPENRRIANDLKRGMGKDDARRQSEARIVRREKIRNTLVPNQRNVEALDRYLDMKDLLDELPWQDRNMVMLILQGRVKTMADGAKVLGMSSSALHRMRRRMERFHERIRKISGSGGKFFGHADSSGGCLKLRNSSDIIHGTVP